MYINNLKKQYTEAFLCGKMNGILCVYCIPKELKAVKAYSVLSYRVIEKLERVLPVSMP